MSSSLSSEGHAQVESLEQFFACLYEPDDVIELRRVPVRDKQHARLRVKAWCNANELSSQMDWLREGERDQRHIFASVNPRLREGESGDKAVAIARCLYADLDDTTPDQAQDDQSQNDQGHHDRERVQGLQTPCLAILGEPGL